MKLLLASKSFRAFTRVEGLVVACGVVFFLLLFVPIGRAKVKSRRSQCISNLKQMGTAVLIYSADNGDRPLISPLTVRTQGIRGDLITIAFRPLSNFLSSPRMVSCPGLARHRPPAASWSTLQDRNIGYAIGDGALVIGDLDVEGGTEQKVEWGQVTGVARLFPGLDYGRPVSTIQWSNTNHIGVGQLLLIDGTVLSADNLGLRRQLSLSEADGKMFRLFLPR